MKGTGTSSQNIDEQIRSFFALEPEAMKCPVKAFSALRENAPVRYLAASDLYLATGRAEVTAILGDTEAFSSASNANAETSHNFTEMLDRATRIRAAESGEDAGDAVTNYPKVPPHSDPPHHSRQRRLLLPAFSARKARAAETVLTELADSLIDQFIDDGTVELRAQYSEPLMVRFVLRELHCGPEDAPTLLTWVNQFAQLQGSRLDDQQLDEIAHARTQFDAYFLQKISEVREAPTDDVLSKLVHAEFDGDTLSTGELLMICQTLLVGGTETSSSTTNNAFLFLAQHPDIAARLRADENLVTAFVEETLRLNGPIHMLFRQAMSDVTIAGVTIPKGARVGVHLGAAGRDPDRCPAPDALDLEREQPAQIMFGSGPHFCAGAQLGRTQVRVAVGTLLKRLDAIRLDVPETEIDFYPQVNLHRMKALPLRFAPRR